MHRPMKWLTGTLLMTSLVLVASSFAAQDGNRGNDKSGKYRGLDRNNDGVISRGEWRGNSNSFSVHDKNGDGVLSGNEIGPALDEARYDDFAAIDGNRDNLVSRGEWRWDRADFDRLDGNRDGMLTRQEYQNSDGTGADANTHFSPIASSTPAVIQPATATPTATTGSDRYARFRQLDKNGNGLIARAEWNGDRKSFNELDQNNNGDLSREEFVRLTPAQSKVLFNGLDQNGNGTISKTEWRGDKQAFARLDLNNDDKLGRDEFTKSYRSLEQRFNELDKDHLGMLSREEWHGDKQAFEKLDDNHDGQVSFEEFVGVS